MKLDAARARLVVTWGGRTPAFDSAEGALEPIAAIPSAAHLAERIAQNPDIARWATEMAQRQAALDLAGAQRIRTRPFRAGSGFRDPGDNAMVMQFSPPLPVFNRNQGGFLEALPTGRGGGEAPGRRSAGAHCSRRSVWGARQRLCGSDAIAETRFCQGRNRAFDAVSELSAGKFGFLEVLDAQRTLFESRGRYLGALTAYHRGGRRGRRRA